VVVLAPPGPLQEKTASNLQEVAARGARVLLLSDAEGVTRLGPLCAAACALPDVPPLLVPMVYGIPLQLLAYQVALRLGTDIDKPRNLAKSVTVE
jgi:glucosamine--fructose-6-phosphate aminotransferase (isomerizing)